MSELEELEKLIEDKLKELKELMLKKKELLCSDKLEAKRLSDITKLL